MTYIWVHIDSSNGLLPGGTKLLPETILTYHQRYPKTDGAVSRVTPQWQWWLNSGRAYTRYLYLKCEKEKGLESPICGLICLSTWNPHRPHLTSSNKNTSHPWPGSLYHMEKTCMFMSRAVCIIKFHRDNLFVFLFCTYQLIETGWQMYVPVNGVFSGSGNGLPRETDCHYRYQCWLIINLTIMIKFQ